MFDIFKLGLILALVRGIYQKTTNLEVSMANLNEQLDNVNAKLEEAATEIPALIAELREAIGTVSPEAQAKLDAIAAKAQALADIKVDEPETPAEPVEETPVVEEGEDEAPAL